MPRPIAAHRFARRHLEVVPVAERPLQLTLGAPARADAALRAGAAPG